jgi:hypothetical protein
MLRALKQTSRKSQLVYQKARNLEKGDPGYDCEAAWSMKNIKKPPQCCGGKRQT